MQIGLLSWLLLALFVLFVFQSMGGSLQIRDYRAAVRRLHKLGNVGIGQKRGRLLNGHVVIIACDKEGIITGAEAMDGISVWARFHPIREFVGQSLIGNSIYSLLDITGEFDKKKWKRYKGYVRAMEALEARLLGREFTREQQTLMEKKSEKRG